MCCMPWCCWPFVDVELEEPPKKKEEAKKYIMVEDGAQFYPVSGTLFLHKHTFDSSSKTDKLNLNLCFHLI